MLDCLWNNSNFGKKYKRRERSMYPRSMNFSLHMSMLSTDIEGAIASKSLYKAIAQTHEAISIFPLNYS